MRIGGTFPGNFDEWYRAGAFKSERKDAPEAELRDDLADIGGALRALAMRPDSE